MRNSLIVLVIVGALGCGQGENTNAKDGGIVVATNGDGGTDTLDGGTVEEDPRWTDLKTMLKGEYQNFGSYGQFSQRIDEFGESDGCPNKKMFRAPYVVVMCIKDLDTLTLEAWEHSGSQFEQGSIVLCGCNKLERDLGPTIGERCRSYRHPQENDYQCRRENEGAGVLIQYDFTDPSGQAIKIRLYKQIETGG